MSDANPTNLVQWFEFAPKISQAFQPTPIPWSNFPAECLWYFVPIGLATKKRTQKLCNSITSCFVFQSQAANDSQANCEGVGGCKTPL